MQHTSYCIPHCTTLYSSVHLSKSHIIESPHILPARLSLPQSQSQSQSQSLLHSAANSKTHSVVLVNGVDEMLKKGKTTCAALKAAIDGALTILITDATKAKSNMTSSCDKVSQTVRESLSDRESRQYDLLSPLCVSPSLLISPHTTSSFFINHSSRLTWASPTVTSPRHWWTSRTTYPSGKHLPYSTLLSLALPCPAMLSLALFYTPLHSLALPFIPYLEMCYLW